MFSLLPTVPFWNLDFIDSLWKFKQMLLHDHELAAYLACLLSTQGIVVGVRCLSGFSVGWNLHVNVE